ncbi:hypothetical protein KSP39_PZI002683 [Platanthera zijinensis]|uniref:Uncharacterized protein n=1 Tax=Platanthera zijinensis TaxID=2320716 RepID=A0AAP0C1J5_9ASPA
MKGALHFHRICTSLVQQLRQNSGGLPVEEGPSQGLSGGEAPGFPRDVLAARRD